MPCRRTLPLRLSLVCLLPLAAATIPAASVAQLSVDPYAGLQALTYQAHHHPANARQVACMADPSYDPSVQCCHSYHWCDDVFDQARQSGLDALLQVHHAYDLLPANAQSLSIWKSLGLDFQHAFGRRERYPTHPDGLPLAVSGGHTDDEIASLWECAEAKNAPGEFLAFFGIEYSASGALSGSCITSAGQARCGGHKTAVFATRPEITCTSADTGPVEQRCESEAEFYGLVRAHGGLVALAHPTNTAEADFTPFDEASAPGGVDASLVRGYEFGPGREDVPCAGAGGAASCGFQQALALGYRLHPVVAQDLHGHFGAEGEGCFPDRGLAGDDRRGSCWVESFTRAGLLDAMNRLRCVWARTGEPRVKWTLAGTELGGSLSQAELPADPRLELDVQQAGGGELVAWELVHGDLGGGNGNAHVVLSGACEPDRCAAALALPEPASPGWYYLRVQGPSQIEILSAPIWLTESAADPLEIAQGPQGVPNPVVSRGVVSLSVELAGDEAAAASYEWSATCPALGWSGFLLGGTTSTPTWFAPSNSSDSAQVCDVQVVVSDSAGATVSAGFAQQVLADGVPADGDADGLPDDLEAGLQTDPARADSDGDGDSDYVEVVAGSDPLDPGEGLAPRLRERADGSIELGWPARAGRVYELLWADGIARVGSDGVAEAAEFTPFAGLDVVADASAWYVDDGAATGAAPQSATDRLYALRIEGPDPISGEPVQVTGRPAGFVRVAVPENSVSLVAMPFIPVDASLQTLLAGQLSGAADRQQADRVVSVSATGSFRTFWLSDSDAGDAVFLGADGQPSQLDLGCGEAVAVIHRGPGVMLFLSGRLASLPSTVHEFGPGMRLFGLCYAVSGVALEDSGLASDGAIGATSPSRADQVARIDAQNGGMERYYLFDSAGAEPVRDGRWLPIDGSSPLPLRLEAGRGYTYLRQSPTPLLWHEVRPYGLP